jgi:hypothetical protein
MNAPAVPARVYTADGSPPGRPSVAEVVAGLRAEHIADVATRAATFAQKAATASRRGDRRATAVRLRQLHLCTAEAIRSFRGGLGEPEDTL